MRIVNVFALATTAAAVVVAAFVAKHAASAEPERMWLENLEQPVREIAIQRRRDGFVEEAAKFADREGAIGVLRSPKAALPANKTLAARDQGAFEREILRRFTTGDAAALPAVSPLPPQGRRVGGFVSRVRSGRKTCDFGVAAYANAPDAEEIVAIARIILCDPAGQLTTPDVRLGALLAYAEWAE